MAYIILFWIQAKWNAKKDRNEENKKKRPAKNNGTPSKNHEEKNITNAHNRANTTNFLLIWYCVSMKNPKNLREFDVKGAFSLS